EAREVVARLEAAVDASMSGAPAPIAFTTAALDEVRRELSRTRCPMIDFFGHHMRQVEEILGVRGVHAPALLHGVGDAKLYRSRMQAVEYAIEHDDGQSVRSLE